MAVKVDPYVNEIPQQFLEDPELRSWFEYDARWKHDMWNRTGSSSDSVADSDVRETFPWPVRTTESVLADLYKPRVSRETFNAVSVEEDYTAVAYDFVNAKSAAKITLPANPDINDVVVIRNGDGSYIRLDGNDKNINGSELVRS